MALATSGGGYQVGDGNLTEVQMGVQPAPVELPIGTLTYTTAQITSRLLITVAGTAARAHTLPTGAAMDAALPNAKIGSTFDFTMVNLGTSSGVITISPGTGFTIVGVATIAITTSAQFRARRSAESTWVLYRIS
jgi:hypothetical protein